MVKKIIHTILAFCIGILGYSTTISSHYVIAWGNPIGSSTEKSLYFTDANYVNSTHLPYFHTTISLSKEQTIDSVQISNIKYKDLSAEEKTILTNSGVDIESQSEISTIYTTARKTKEGTISILPFIKKGYILKKITSFDLSYQITNKPELRSSKGLHSYASNSKLKSGTWKKISIESSGFYKITYEDLVSWGFSNAANANIFGYGGAMLPEDFSKEKLDDLPQISVWKYKGSDGIFNKGDYILFYAQGPTSWEYNSTAGEFVRTNNNYSDKGYYFISDDIGSEKLISTASTVTDTPTDTVDYFLDHYLYESDKYNILSSGKEWYGEPFNSTTYEYTFDFSIPNIDTNKEQKIRVDAIASSSSVTYMSVYINDNLAGNNLTFYKTGEHDAAKSTTTTYSKTVSSSDIEVRTKYNNPSSGKAWLNYIAINAYRKINLSSSELLFRNPDIVGTNKVALFNFSATNSPVILDITDPTNIAEISTSNNGSTYSFVDNASTLKEYAAINPYGSFPTPTLESSVSNQDLHGVSLVDMVIITPSEFITQANEIAQLHQTHEGISVLVCTPEQVYNEFSSGTPDATAYRWLMKMLYDRSTGDNDMPKSLLLFGDGTYDNKGLLSKNTSVNKLLTYQSDNSLNEISSYVTDDYFGLLEDSEGANISSESLDIGVGRLTVSTTDQADIVVEKISDYIENSNKDYWKNKLCYLADDDDNTLHMGQSDSLAKYMEEYYPAFETKRIFLDAYYQEVTATGESYPTAKEELFNQLNSGSFLLNYTGHGSTEGLANEKLIGRSDVEDMHNEKLPLFVTATCSFSKFDNSESSTGEDVLLKRNGGAIGLFTTTRTVYASENYQLNLAFNNNVFTIENGSPLTFGEIMRRTKNKLVNNTNKLNFTLLADPAIVLPIPMNKIVTTEIISNSNNGTDTINALCTVTIKGEIQSPSGDLLSNFNGTISASVFDKKIKITTLANNSDSLFTYYDRINKLFAGKAYVTNGEFTMTFMIPKDINYNYGTGKFNLYAADETNDIEAQGYYENIIIGGTKNDFTFETQGPNIELYLNNSRFKSGNNVDATSVLYANLSDENGINIGGVGIGHDIVATINNDPNYSFVLNDYYETTIGDYKSGSLAYKLPTLEDGKYTLSLRAWDLLNNSNTASISFTVNNNKKPEIYSVLAQPNPASSYVNFILSHNQPQSDLTFKVEVFSLFGELIWTESQDVYSNNNETSISWDLTAGSGSKIPNGLYIYRITVKSEAEGIVNFKSNKLIVK